MWRDSGASVDSSTAWASPPRPSQQTVVGQPNQGSGVSGGGPLPGQATLLQVAVQPSLQSVGGPHNNVGQQVANNPHQQHGNQTTVGSRSSIVNNPQHTSSRSAEMSLMLAENLAESVLNHQNNTNGQAPNNPSVTAKQIAAAAAVAAGSNVPSGLEKSIQRLSMVSPYC